MAQPSMEEVLDEVRDEVRALRAEVAELRHLKTEVEALRGTQQRTADGLVVAAPGAASPVPVLLGQEDPVPEPVDGSERVDRRGALRAGLLAAGAAAAAVALDASPAAAANGDPIVLGSQANAATGATIASVNASAQTVGLGVWDFSRGSLTPGVFPSIGGHAKGVNFNTAVEGLAEGGSTGVRGQSGTGWGVRGLSSGTNSGAGVVGEGPNIGVYGSSSPGTGVAGWSSTGVGVDAASFLTGTNCIGLRTTGSHAHLRFSGLINGERNAPTLDSVNHFKGDVVWDKDGELWLCTVDGTPGTWRKMSGKTTAGSLHVLNAPIRVYDSRVGTQPAVGSKTKLVPNTARVLDVRVNSSGVPTGATAALLTILLINAATANGNFTVWANGVTRPSANTMVWGPGGGRFTATAVSALSGGGGIQVLSSHATDIAVDVVGYYR